MIGLLVRLGAALYGLLFVVGGLASIGGSTQVVRLGFPIVGIFAVYGAVCLLFGGSVLVESVRR